MDEIMKTRRGALGLAAAVATFGAALGMNAAGAAEVIKRSATTPATGQAQIKNGAQSQFKSGAPPSSQMKLRSGSTQTGH